MSDMIILALIRQVLASTHRLETRMAVLDQALETVLDQIQAIVSQHASDVKAQIDAAVAAQAAMDQTAFDTATAKAKSILDQLTPTPAPAPTPVA